MVLGSQTRTQFHASKKLLGTRGSLACRWATEDTRWDPAEPPGAGNVGTCGHAGL